jgi:hypothetical protein
MKGVGVEEGDELEASTRYVIGDDLRLSTWCAVVAFISLSGVGNTPCASARLSARMLHMCRGCQAYVRPSLHAQQEGSTQGLDPALSDQGRVLGPADPSLG